MKFMVFGDEGLFCGSAGGAGDSARGSSDLAGRERDETCILVTKS